MPRLVGWLGSVALVASAWLLLAPAARGESQADTPPPAVETPPPATTGATTGGARSASSR